MVLKMYGYVTEPMYYIKIFFFYFLSAFYSDRLPEEIEADNQEQEELSTKSENKVWVIELLFIRGLYRGGVILLNSSIENWNNWWPLTNHMSKN